MAHQLAVEGLRLEARGVQRAASLSNRRGVPFPTLKVMTARPSGEGSHAAAAAATPTVGVASEGGPGRAANTRQEDNGQILPGSPTLPAEIQPFLYLGGEQHANDLQMLDDSGITAILNVAAECERKRFEDRFLYLQLPISDSFDEDIMRYFTQAFEFIGAQDGFRLFLLTFFPAFSDQARDSKGRVLVHCSAGKSRSPTIVMAYLISRSRWPLCDAYKFVSDKRKICPNLGFVWFLAEFQKSTIGGNPEETLQELCRASVPLEFNVLLFFADDKLKPAEQVGAQVVRLGHKFDVVNSLDRALERITHGRYDVVLIDWDVGAAEAARRIRELEEKGNVRANASLIAVVPAGAEAPSQPPFAGHLELPVDDAALEAALGRPVFTKRRNSF